MVHLMLDQFTLSLNDVDVLNIRKWDKIPCPGLFVLMFYISVKFSVMIGGFFAFLGWTST